MKRTKKLLSVMLIMCMLITMLPMFTIPAAAASEDIGSQNALEALGIDTSKMPEGYDPNTLDNPYGRDTVTINPVYELFMTSKGDNDNQRKNVLYGHNKALKQGMDEFYSSGILSTTTNEYPQTAATASASGNFIGKGADGKAAGKKGQVATVGAGSLDKNGGLYLYFTDPVKGKQSGKKTLIGTDKVIGNSGNQMDEDFSEWPYLMQNYLKITAGDFDNDGIDEVAVYVPEQGKSRVEVYKLHTTTGAGDDFYLTQDNWKKEWTYYFNEAPYVSNMVSLTSGDFSRDGIDDLALTWGYYYGPNKNNGCQAVVLYGSNTSMLQKKKAIDLNYDGAQIVRAAFTYGDIDGDNVDDLILGGQLATDIAAGNLNTRFIGIYTYDGSTDNFIQSTAKNFDFFEKNDNGEYVYMAMEREKVTFYSSPASVANIASVNMDGLGQAAHIYFDSILYKFGDDGLDIEMALDNNPSFNKNIDGTQKYYVEYGAVSADFTGNSKETLQIMQYYLPFFNRTPGEYINWIIKLLEDYINTYYPGDLDMLAVYGSTESIESTESTENTQFRRTDDVEFSTSFCRLNTDDDTCLLSYTGKHYVVYSDPRVLAVLASPPYFEDLDNDELSGSYMESETSYTSSSGEGTESSYSHTLSVGQYISYSHDIEVPLPIGGSVKVGSVEAEAAYSHGFTWETAESSTLEQSISYSTAAGSDSVAFYSIPMEVYVYDSLIPIVDEDTGEITGYDKQYMSVNIPHTAAVKVLPLETYEKIAADYPELPQIAGNVLTHTVGDPSTYPKSTSSFNKAIVYNGDWSGVDYGNGSVTQEIAMTDETENSFSYTNSIETKAGAGPGDFVFGYSIGYEFGYGKATVTTKGSNFSGTICNMPAEAEPYNYYYAWKIFAYQYSDGESSFPVVSYLVTDVTAPPKLPKDFNKDTDKTTSDQITLKWSYTGAAAGFQIYRYYEFPDGDGSYELAFVPASDAVGADTGTGTRYYEYADTGLDPYAEYDYQIQVIGATQPAESILSPVYTFRTKTDVGYPDISLEGENLEDGKLKVYPDTESTVSVNIENIGDYTQTPRYQWQKLTEDGWTDIKGAIGKNYTFRNTGLADEGQYRCRVNAIYQNYYISDYSEVFTLEYSKRTPMVVDGSFKVTDANDEGTIPKIEISLKSAHANHSYMPTGNVVFEVTGTDYKRSFSVALTEGSSGEANAGITLDDPLPAGAYEITAYYTGSRVYKALTTKDIPYLSGSGSGYRLTLDSRYTYGDPIKPTLKSLKKESGVTTEETISGEISYEVFKVKQELKWDYKTITTFLGTLKIPILVIVTHIDPAEDFIKGDGSVTAARTGDCFRIYAYVDGIEVASKDFSVDKREIIIGINDQEGEAGNVTHPDSSILYVHSGSLAYNDTIADLGLVVRATNSAGNEVTINKDTDPGSYEIVGTVGPTPGSKYGNYSISYIPGIYVLTGPRYSVTGVAKQLNGKTVGTIEMVTPEGNDNVNWTTKYSNGTGLVFQAKPYKGYDVKSWSVVDESGKVIATKGSSLTLNHTMLSENITVTVEFQVTQSTLQYKAMGGKGGTVQCISDAVMQSGAVARNGAEFTFKAIPDEGYHFVEWQLIEIGKNPAKPVGTPGEDGSSTCEITMGTGNTVLYGVFARDSYEITLQGDLQARYWEDPEIEGEDGRWVIAHSGDKIEGDKQVTVEAKPGFSVISDAAWTQDGEEVTNGVSDDNQSYTFTILSDTTIAVETQVEHYDVTLSVSGPGNNENTVSVTVNGEAVEPDNLTGIAGGSNLVFTPKPAYGYVFDEWVVNGENRTENILNITALSKDLDIEAVFKDNDAYTVNVSYNLHGSLSYTINGGEPSDVASGDKIHVFEGDTVVLTAIPEAGFMVEYWEIDGDVVQTYAKKQTFENIAADIDVYVAFASQSYSTVTYSVDGGDGSISAKSDGIPFESGSNSVGNGSTLIFTASPEAGKMVDKWTLNGKTVKNDFGSDLVDDTFIIPALSGDADVEVSFRDIVKHDVTIDDDEHTTTTVEYFPDLFEDEVRDGAAAVFTVTPDPGYAVDEVSVTGATVDGFDKVTENEDGTWTCTISSINEDMTISAKAIPLYTIIVSGTMGGTVTGGGSYKEGDSVTVTASADEGYKFVNWTMDGVELSTDTEYSFTVSADCNLTANFEAIPIYITVNGTTGGTVTGGGSYVYGQSVTVTASADKGYKFVSWTDEGGAVVSKDAEYTFEASKDCNLTANFEVIPSGGGGGGGGSVPAVEPSGDYVNDNAIIETEKQTKVDLTQGSTKISSEQMESLIDKNKDKPIVITGENYSITFEQGTMELVEGQTDYDFGINFNVSEDSNTINELTGGHQALVVSYNYSGKLPAEASIRMNVGTQYAGQTMNYYYYNPSTKSLEYVGSVTVGDDGYVEVKQTHCSDYVLIPDYVTISGNDSLPRIGGLDRYDTSALISQAGWTGSDTVIIARSDDFADALAGAPLAYKLGAPVLLTATDKMNDKTSAEIKRLQAKKAVILGGTGAVSQDVEQSLKNMNLEVKRIEGVDRFETAALIAREVAPLGAETTVVVYGMNFPDALSVSSYAAAKGIPILLTDTNSIPKSTLDAIHDLKVKNTLVIGGSGVIADDVLNELPGAERLGGSDRYSTCMEIASYFHKDTEKVYVATGLDFADAVSGAALAAKQNTGILLVDGKQTKGDILPEGLDKFIQDKGITGISILGGTGAVNNDTCIKLKDLLK